MNFVTTVTGVTGVTGVVGRRAKFEWGWLTVTGVTGVVGLVGKLEIMALTRVTCSLILFLNG
ncbi:MAG TPA: hypothetical protein VK140_11220 [Ktedonobacteraceae bacterium]|nr:hypothetical protein [Ktedonobacteraceae bacterium]